MNHGIYFDSKYANCAKCDFKFISGKNIDICCCFKCRRALPIDEQPPRRHAQLFIYEIFVHKKRSFSLEALLEEYYKVSKNYKPSTKEESYYWDYLNSKKELSHKSNAYGPYATLAAVRVLRDYRWLYKADEHDLKSKRDKRVVAFMSTLWRHLKKINDDAALMLELKYLYKLIGVKLEDVANRKYDFLIPDRVDARIGLGF